MTGQRATAEGRRVGEVVLNRYQLTAVIGFGGMGEVYQADDRFLERRVAIKCLWPELARDGQQVQRFEREARAAGAVASAHLADVMDTGVLPDGSPFLVMELLSGETLAAALASVPAFPVGRAASIARQLASGLSAAHGARIVHRDLKPENVFLVLRPTQREFVKILDFGISKFRTLDLQDNLTHTGTAIGTPAYMSPEQSGGSRDVDHRADIWALGVILHRMLSGELPFTAENYARLLLRIVSDAAPQVRDRRPDVPEGLEAVIARCLEKEPERRFQSMAEVAAALTPFERSTAKLELVGTPAMAQFDAPTRVADVSPALLSSAAARTEVESGHRRRDAIGAAPSARAPVPNPRASSDAPSALEAPAATQAARAATLAAPVVARRDRDASRPIGRIEMDRARQDAPAQRVDLPAIDPGFRVPRESYSFDVAEVLEIVPIGATVKGLFLQSMLDRIQNRERVFERARVEPMRIVAFLDIEYDAYLRLVTASAEEMHPGLPTVLALRRFHQAFYEIFADTLAGRVMQGALERDASSVMPAGAQWYKVNFKIGEVRAYALSPRHVRFDFRAYPKAICECCDVGIIEGALRALGEPRARVLIREDGADAMTIDASW